MPTGVSDRQQASSRPNYAFASLRKVLFLTGKKGCFELLMSVVTRRNITTTCGCSLALCNPDGYMPSSKPDINRDRNSPRHERVIAVVASHLDSQYLFRNERHSHHNGSRYTSLHLCATICQFMVPSHTHKELDGPETGRDLIGPDQPCCQLRRDPSYHFISVFIPAD